MQLLRKTVAGNRNNNSKPIDIYHDQDGHNLVESPWKSFVFGQKNKKDSDHVMEDAEYVEERLPPGKG